MISQVTIVVVAVPEGLPLAVTLTYVYLFLLLSFQAVGFLMIAIGYHLVCLFCVILWFVLD